MTSPGSWLALVRAWDAYQAGRVYWVPSPHDSLLVEHGYATRLVPQPEKRITRGDVA